MTQNNISARNDHKDVERRQSCKEDSYKVNPGPKVFAESVALIPVTLLEIHKKSSNTKEVQEILEDLTTEQESNLITNDEEVDHRGKFRKDTLLQRNLEINDREDSLGKCSKNIDNIIMEQGENLQVMMVNQSCHLEDKLDQLTNEDSSDTPASPNIEIDVKHKQFHSYCGLDIKDSFMSGHNFEKYVPNCGRNSSLKALTKLDHIRTNLKRQREKFETNCAKIELVDERYQEMFVDNMDMIVGKANEISESEIKYNKVLLKIENLNAENTALVEKFQYLNHTLQQYKEHVKLYRMENVNSFCRIKELKKLILELECEIQRNRQMYVEELLAHEATVNEITRKYKAIEKEYNDVKQVQAVKKHSRVTKQFDKNKSMKEQECKNLIIFNTHNVHGDTKNDRKCHTCITNAQMENLQMCEEKLNLPTNKIDKETDTDKIINCAKIEELQKHVKLFENKYNGKVNFKNVRKSSDLLQITCNNQLLKLPQLNKKHFGNALKKSNDNLQIKLKLFEENFNMIKLLRKNFLRTKQTHDNLQGKIFKLETIMSNLRNKLTRVQPSS